VSPFRRDLAHPGQSSNACPPSAHDAPEAVAPFLQRKFFSVPDSSYSFIQSRAEKPLSSHGFGFASCCLGTYYVYFACLAQPRSHLYTSTSVAGKEGRRRHSPGRHGQRVGVVLSVPKPTLSAGEICSRRRGAVLAVRPSTYLGR